MKEEWFPLVDEKGETIGKATRKECHSGCAIFKKMGECIMPKQGVFTRVLHGGVIHPGDELTILD